MFAVHDNVKFKGDIFVPGSNYHYKKEFLLARISYKTGPSTTKWDYMTTFQDKLSSCKVITSVDFNKLKPLKIIDLEPGKIHSDRVIRATLIDDGFIMMKAYHTVIEDMHAQCAKLCIYNTTPNLLTSLKKGTKIEIANPLYKLGMNDGYYFIRVESPEEVNVIREVNQENVQNGIKSSDDYKIEGNKYYKSDQFREAIACYTCAVKIDESNPIYVSNRAQCYLRLGLFEEALLDSEIAIILSPNTEKYLYRLAKAWSGLGNHEKSFEILKNMNMENKDISSFFSREKIFLDNSNGKFDFDFLEKEIKQGKGVEIGNFIGPITIGVSDTHDHGVFATRAIQKGEPILVWKALAFVSYADTANDPNPTYLFENVAMGKASNKRTRMLIDSVTAKISQSKLAAFQVLNLSLIHRNKEHIPIELYTGKGFERIRDKSKPPYQIDQIRKIVQDNEFGFLPAECSDSPSGFWPILAYFNHSCLANSVPSFYGNICVVRACTYIPEGSEINTKFLSAFGKVTLEERRVALLENWNFVCDCDLCRFESDPKNKDVLKRGIILMNRAKKISSLEYNSSGMIQDSHFNLLTKAFTLAEEMNLGPTNFNSSVWTAIHYLTNIKIDVKDHKRYYEALLKARQFLCDYELEHQHYYWIKCCGFVKFYRANVPEDFKVESERNIRHFEILLKRVDYNFSNMFQEKIV